MSKLVLTQEWDKKFPKSDKVDHKKVTFHGTVERSLRTAHGRRYPLRQDGTVLP